MDLIVKLTGIIQRYYEADGTTIKMEKFTNLSPGTCVNYDKGQNQILLGVNEYSDFDYMRKIDYSEVERYSTDGTTFTNPPAIYDVYQAIVANIELQAISSIGA